MIRIDHSIVIERPLDVVFAYVSDLENMPKWGTSLGVTKLTDGPIAVGTRYQEKAEFRGRPMEFPDEVVALEANEKFAVRTTTKFMDSTTTTTFSAVPEGTQLDYLVEAVPHGLFTLAAPMVRPRIQKQFVADVANLKKVLESEGSG